MIRNRRYNKVGVGILLFVIFLLSSLSNLDCQFVKIDVGFAPQNARGLESPQSTFGIGLWNFENIEHPNSWKCIKPVFLKKDRGSLTNDDDIYTAPSFISGDAHVTWCRILSIVGLSLICINLVIIWGSTFDLLEDESPRKAATTIYLVLGAFICEGLKIGLMFMALPCTASEFWERIDEDEVSQFSQADQCFVSRAGYISMTAAILELALGLYALTSILKENPSIECCIDQESSTSSLSSLQNRSNFNKTDTLRHYLTKKLPNRWIHDDNERNERFSCEALVSRIRTGLGETFSSVQVRAQAMSNAIKRKISLSHDANNTSNFCMNDVEKGSTGSPHPVLENCQLVAIATEQIITHDKNTESLVSSSSGQQMQCFMRGSITGYLFDERKAGSSEKADEEHPLHLSSMIGTRNSTNETQQILLEVPYEKLKEEGISTCRICLCDSADGGPLCRLGCGHVYHLECITLWCEKDRIRCPLCNFDWKPEWH